MSLKEEIRQEVRQERKKLKDMSFRDKLWYIWEYYKLHMLVVLGVVLLISVVASSIYSSTFETVFYCAVINNPAGLDDVSSAPLDEGFREYMGFGEKDRIYMENMYVSYGGTASEYEYASMAKLSALIAARELDVIISDQEIFDRHSHMDGYVDLDTLVPEDLAGQLQDRYCMNTDSAGVSHVYAIDISGTSFAEAMGIGLEPAYLSVLSSSRHTDTCAALLRYIFAP